MVGNGVCGFCGCGRSERSSLVMLDGGQEREQVVDVSLRSPQCFLFSSVIIYSRMFAVYH